MCEIPGRNANAKQSCVTAADLYKRLEHSQCNVVVCFLTALGNFALMAVCSQYHSRDSIHARSVPGLRKGLMPVSCGSRPSGSSKSLSLHWTFVVYLSTCSPEWMRSLSDRIAEEIAVIDPERKQREEKPRPQIRGLGPEASRPFIIRSFQILEKHLATLGPDHHARRLMPES